jgi:hypothetical protein
MKLSADRQRQGIWGHETSLLKRWGERSFGDWEAAGSRARRRACVRRTVIGVRSFETVEEWRAALIEFKQFYNETWILERPGYKTQAQIRQQQSGRLAEVA